MVGIGGVMKQQFKRIVLALPPHTYSKVMNPLSLNAVLTTARASGILKETLQAKS